jgi:hypothetical protein
MKKPSTPARTPAPRVVYEIRTGTSKPVTVEATSAADLAGHLATLAGLDPYGSRAAAHVLHVLRGTTTAPTFSARRLGVLEFRADEQATAPAPRQVQEGQQSAEVVVSSEAQAQQFPNSAEIQVQGDDQVQLEGQPTL